jgi:hypothetical protein
MGVGVDDARDYGLAIEIDHLRRCVREHSGFGVGSYEQNAAATDGQRGSNWAGIVDGVDLSVDEDEVSFGLRPKHGWCERGERKVGWEMSHAPEFAV